MVFHLFFYLLGVTEVGDLELGNECVSRRSLEICYKITRVAVGRLLCCGSGGPGILRGYSSVDKRACGVIVR